METYESKVVAIGKRAEDIYRVLSDFRNFSALAEGKVDNWQADETSCSFSYQGMGPMGIKLMEKEEFTTLKFTGDERVPLQFYLWIQLKEAAPYDTRMKITIKAELNMMMKMLLGKKLAEGVNTLAEGVAKAFNAI
ncbi:MAG: polyketide cyclase [Bacteroidales bacterium]|nr:polyketide cyclase [Bacteroidales bacterium]